MWAVYRLAGSRWRQRRGTSALELALILPVLITIVLGCVDFGRFAYFYIAVTNAARAGAGVGSFTPVTSNTQEVWEQLIREAVEDEMGPAFDPNLITMSATPIVEEEGGLKRARVEVGYPFNTIVNWPGMPTNLTLTRAVEMRFIR